MSIVTIPRITTLIAASIGAALFVIFGFPLPLLLGPLMGCLAFALMGAKLQTMGALGIFFRTFLGVAIGSSVTSDLLTDIPKYLPTLALVPLYVLTIGAIAYPFFRKFMGYNHATAYYSAMPGGLQDMLVFGEEAGGNVRAMSLVHATRVVVIVTGAPILLTAYLGLDLTRPPGAPAADFALLDIAVLVAAGYGGWKIAAKLGMFGASILGPLILTALLSVTGIIQSRPPVEMIWIAQFFIGIAVGAKYSGITKTELKRDVFAGFVFSLILAGISLLFIAAITRFSDINNLEVMLAFLPGGQSEMSMIAIVAGADVAFVVSHHLLRIFVVILFAPVVARMFGR